MTKKIKGIQLSKIRAISLYEPENFSKDTLAGEYNKSNIQGQQYLGDISFKGSKEEELIDALEKYSDGEKLKKVREYFDNYTKCFFSGKDRKKHVTFTSGRGLNFYERHHFILANYLDKINSKEARKLKKDHNILIHLCPICHRQLHHGKAEDVKNMIDTIYYANREWFDNNLLSFAEEDKYSDVLEWIYYIYNCERKKYKYELVSKSET